MVFTGIVRHLGRVVGVTPASLRKPHSLTIYAGGRLARRCRVGDSVAVDGVCLTVSDLRGPLLTFDVIKVTLDVTTLRDAKVGSGVHLERACRYGRDRLDGHTLSGHATDRAKVLENSLNADGSRTLRLLPLKPLLATESVLYRKGSVGVNGVSLTVAEVKPYDLGGRAMVLQLIPHTMNWTLLDRLKEGSCCNIEYDYARSVPTALGPPQTSSAVGSLENGIQAVEDPDNADQRCRSSDSSIFARKDSGCGRDAHRAMLRHMRAAMREGDKGRWTAPPNPWVGCVAVDIRDGRIVARGYHKAPGERHAERVVLDQLAQRKVPIPAAHVRLYTTLEPCCGTWPGKRQPPCAEAILASGIREVVIGVLDPDERVRGHGAQALRAEGVLVRVLELSKDLMPRAAGALLEQLQLSLAPYLHHRRTGMPYVVVKSGVSIDGGIALSDGRSQWITGPDAREDAHRLRAASQAVLVGAQTAVLDSPRLTVRLSPDQQHPLPAPPPMRCIIDPHGRVTSGPLLWADPMAGRTIVFCSVDRPPPSEAMEQWMAAPEAVTVVSLPTQLSVDGPQVSLRSLLRYLGSLGVLQLLVEGGPRTIAGFLDEGLVDEMVFYVAPVLLGRSSRRLAACISPLTLDSAVRFVTHSVCRLPDGDVRIRLRAAHSAAK